MSKLSTLLISSVLCPDPVIYIDDRWLYEQEDVIEPIVEKEIENKKYETIETIMIMTLPKRTYLDFISNNNV